MQLSERDKRLYFLIPKYSEQIAKHIPDEYSDVLTLELFLAQIIFETEADPLFVSNSSHRRGLLGVHVWKWNKLWANVLGESYKDIFSSEASIELQLRYLCYLYRKFGDIKLTLMAHYWNEQLIEYCVKKGCDFSRIDSFLVYAAEWDVKERPGKKRIRQDMFVKAFYYPGYVLKRIKDAENSLEKLRATKEHWENQRRKNEGEIPEDHRYSVAYGADSVGPG